MAKEEMKTNEEENTNDRRNFLRTGLAAAAGLTYGFTVIKHVFAQQKMETPLTTVPMDRENIRVKPGGLRKQPRIPENFQPSLQRKRQLAEQIAPTLENILNDAGVKFSPEEMQGIKEGLIRRGNITIPAAGTRANYSVNVAANCTVD
jgi:hypothetical protein